MKVWQPIPLADAAMRKNWCRYCGNLLRCSLIKGTELTFSGERPVTFNITAFEIGQDSWTRTSDLGDPNAAFCSAELCPEC